MASRVTFSNIVYVCMSGEKLGLPPGYRDEDGWGGGGSGGGG